MIRKYDKWGVIRIRQHMIEIQGCINFGLIQNNFHTLAIIIFKTKTLGFILSV